MPGGEPHRAAQGADTLPVLQFYWDTVLFVMGRRTALGRFAGDRHFSILFQFYLNTMLFAREQVHCAADGISFLDICTAIFQARYRQHCVSGGASRL